MLLEHHTQLTAWSNQLVSIRVQIVCSNSQYHNFWSCRRPNRPNSQTMDTPVQVAYIFYPSSSRSSIWTVGLFCLPAWTWCRAWSNISNVILVTEANKLCCQAYVRVDDHSLLWSLEWMRFGTPTSRGFRIVKDATLVDAMNELSSNAESLQWVCRKGIWQLCNLWVHILKFEKHNWVINNLPIAHPFFYV